MNEDDKFRAKVSDVIQDVVPGMIFDSISTHAHQGGESQNITGDSLVNAPQNALTPASGGTLTTGGAAILSTADSTILANAITRIGQLESRLQALGLISS